MADEGPSPAVTRVANTTLAQIGEAGVRPSVMERRADRLRGQGTTVEFHRYPNVGHGFGLGTGTSAEGWVRVAIRFWERAMPKR
jgi:acetyl esterase/lipase